MSNPNEQHAGENYLGERNTMSGQDYLDMSPEDQKHFWYFFLLYCQKYDQNPYALLVDKNGYRMLAVDHSALRHRFAQALHSKVAGRGRGVRGISSEDNFWTKGRPEPTTLLEGSIEDALLDVFQPAIDAGCDASEFAIKITEDDWGEVVTATRPRGVSRRYPASVSLEIKPPPELAHLGAEGARAHAKKLIASERLATEAETKPKGSARRRPRRRTKGRFAGRGDLVEAANAAYRQFTAAHYVARIAFREGRRDVVFPAGTVFWRHIVGVRVAPREQSAGS